MTQNGMVQGSWIFQLLLNIYINDLIANLSEKEVKARAFEDGLMGGCKTR